MKKILLFVTAFLYTFYFAGCSDIKKPSQENSFESSETVQSEIEKTKYVEPETTESAKEKSEVIKIGEPAETEKWKITVLGVKEYSKINGDYSMEYTPENENNIFITIYFEVENLDFEENFFSLMAYSMAIVDGNSIYPSYTAMPEKTNNFSMGCKIPAREKLVGGVTFEVSPDWKYVGIAYSETSDFLNNCVFGIYDYDVSE